ncbi:hypothetical protein MNBD_GAMMA12-2669 [hydrothermal vent metagenome]|uniref:DUF2157 domain-containing protein n=1 Tax=hydrothermal vent metagenome TaxID=652676 RepID=A0A3B0YL06_9ZZZZ
MSEKYSDISSKQVNDEILSQLVRTGVFNKQDYSKLRRLSGLVPDKEQWLRFLYGFVFSLGTIFLLLGIILFFAWNWSDLRTYQKLLLVEGIFLGSGIFALFTKSDNLSGQLSITAVCVMTGVVLAVYGQIYQTGADNYRLFMGWALLIVLPVMTSRFAPLWFFWAALMNLSIMLWVSQTWHDDYMHLRIGLALDSVNFGLFLIWSAYIYTRCTSLKIATSPYLDVIFKLIIPVSAKTDTGQYSSASEMPLWMFRIIYLVTLTGLTITLFQIIAIRSPYYTGAVPLVSYFSFLIIALYLLTITLAQYLTHKVLKDLFIYTVSLFSLCSLTCFIFYKSFEFFQHLGWLLSLFVIFLAVGSAYWLRKVQNDWKINS